MIKRFIAAALVAGAFWGTVYGGGIAEDTVRVSGQADTSYALGMLVGMDIEQTGLPVNYGAFLRGFRDILEGRETDISVDEAVLRFQTAYQAAARERAGKNQEMERLFLEENGRREGVITTGSGLQYEVISAGEEGGERPGPGSLVRVNYEGSLLDGTVFDSSYDRGEPEDFPLGAVTIPGWSEGIRLMAVGSIYRLYIPSRLAYGDQGAGGVIPPGALLIFDVELLEILDAPGESPEDPLFFSE